MARRRDRPGRHLPAAGPSRAVRRRPRGRGGRHHRRAGGGAGEPTASADPGRPVPAGEHRQLFRVYVRPEHRRRGLARALVDLATEFVAAQASYRALYLHTDTRVEGAEGFWRSVAVPVHDARDGRPDTHQTVHFEIPLPVYSRR
ncbi:GNAT family N-acetyltransferase [Micromonospora echinofusca]|uniref:GNAT family N-acetyltransferase n=1 Tax=Micromonospora echinofusca TaxID=47858 RepID=UPI0033CB5A05